MDIIKSQRLHGMNMYAIAIEHAINVIEICKLDGSDPAPALAKHLAKHKKEISELENESEACND